MYNLPLGPPLDEHPAKRPERTTLRGGTVTLVPLDAEAHAEALFRGAKGGEGDRAWTYLPYGPFRNRVVFKASIAAKAQLNDALFFAILDNSTGEAVGHQAFHRIEPTHRVIEVGHSYTPGMQRTIGATEAQYLFAAYIFDALGYRRYEWRCDDRNAASKRAAARSGYLEGVFRQHMIIKGPQPRHRLVLDAGLGMASAPRRLRALARSRKFRCGGGPEGVAHGACFWIEIGHDGVQRDRRSPHLSTPTQVRTAGASRLPSARSLLNK